MAKRSPRTAAGKPRRVPVSTKITPELRDRIDAAATAAGRTLGNEIERRLERSTRFKEELLDILEDERTLVAAAAIAISWSSIETITGRKWYSSVDTLLAAQASAHSVMGIMRAEDGNSISGAPEKINQDQSANIIALGSALAETTRNLIKGLPNEGAANTAIALAEIAFGHPPEEQLAQAKKKSRQTV